MKDYEDEEYDVKPVKHHWFRNTMIVLILVCVIVLGGGYLFRDKVKEKAASVIGNQVVEKAAESLGIPSEQAQEILNSMSDEDKQTVTDIVSNHMDSQTISKAQQYVKDGDVAGAKEFAESELSPDEQNELKGIAQKYADQINSLKP